MFKLPHYFPDTMDAQSWYLYRYSLILVMRLVFDSSRRVHPGCSGKPPFGKKSAWPRATGNPNTPPSVCITSTNSASDGVRCPILPVHMYSGKAGSSPAKKGWKPHVGCYKMRCLWLLNGMVYKLHQISESGFVFLISNLSCNINYH